ncbi:hypothetical protein pipiens_013549 [Culex pipiens pipiens]|uniref:Uncharacterized protein n=1 Tax=Culex pipiens pipiens TaxID=38569 RepID=A0ABD1CY20_CULPP
MLSTDRRAVCAGPSTGSGTADIDRAGDIELNNKKVGTCGTSALDIYKSVDSEHYQQLYRAFDNRRKWSFEHDEPHGNDGRQ